MGGESSKKILTIQKRKTVERLLPAIAKKIPLHRLGKLSKKWSKHVILKKQFYSIKDINSTINREFEEFFISTITPEEFHSLIDIYFFELSRKTHRHILDNSMQYAYPSGYKNPRQKEYDRLVAQKRSLQKEIDSVVKEHFFLKNDTFIISTNTPTTDASSGAIYIMQSGKKRWIRSNDVYVNLKSRKRGGDQEDQNFLVYVDDECLAGIPSGPDIQSLDDANLDPFIINIYPVTPDEYDYGETKERYPLAEATENEHRENRT